MASRAGGGHGYPVNDLIRQPRRLLCAALWGLWEVESDDARWIQLHDETLTEVLAIAPASGDPGVATVSAYGLAFGQRGVHGATRWRSRSDGLSLNERFSNALLAQPYAPGQWLVGTENGVLVYAEADDCWQTTNLTGRPCRALLHAFGYLWAGTDQGGIWRSEDGFSASTISTPASCSKPWRWKRPVALNTIDGFAAAPTSIWRAGRVRAACRWIPSPVCASR
ncbi:MAG TPA: hypothetical protein EYO90_05670 [Candidatus Latescibacteria bacterium]|nr:hypothetical protein [Candidatus Latescibacterota bacterium]